MAVRSRTLDLFTGQPEKPVTACTRPAKPFPDSTATADARLWMALHFSRLPLEALLAGGERPGTPLVIVETVGHQQQVIACNTAAVDKGIGAGMGMNAAHALARQLLVWPRDPDRERACLERLALLVGRVTPRVSLADDALLLEVQGSLKLFGGIEKLSALLLGRLVRQQVTASLSFAPVSSAALWLARAAIPGGVRQSAALRSALAGLPLRVTGWSQSVIGLLESMGIDSLGDCLRMPRDGLARRIGPGYLLELDRAVGRSIEVRRDFRPRVRFQATVHFDAEIGSETWLGQELEPLAGKLATFLTRRQSAVQALEFSLYHRSGKPTREVLRFAAPVSRVEPMMTLLRELLAGKRLPAPVRSVRLRSGRLFPSSASTGPMPLVSVGEDFREQEPEAILRLVEKLRTRLGASACYRLRAVADHRPEKASTGSPDLQAQVAHSPVTSHDRLRPFWLLAIPEPLLEQRGWPLYRGELVFESGPERIESGWWDGRDVMRDYYVVRTPAGVRLWVYRNRVAPHDWFLHGFLG